MELGLPYSGLYSYISGGEAIKTGDTSVSLAPPTSYCPAGLLSWLVASSCFISVI